MSAGLDLEKGQEFIYFLLPDIINVDEMKLKQLSLLYLFAL